MESSKNDGESTNHGDAASVDWLSALPEVLILQILEQLPVENAVATSTLSKQSQFLWQKLPNLKFDASHHNSTNVTFSDHVTRSLLSHKSLNLESLDLKARLDRCTEVDIKTMIDIACSRNVRNLELEVQPPELFRFPTSLYNYEKLETLKLKYLVLKDIPADSLSLKSVRNLELNYVDFQDEDSLLNLLCGCPNLQNLIVQGYPFNDEQMIFKIVVPSLQRLTISDCKGSVKYLIYAPYLTYLKIEMLEYFEFSQIMENLPMLELAHIIDVSLRTTHNILGYLTSAQGICSLALPFSKDIFPTGSIFHRLIYLELITNDIDRWNLLTLMLRSSPILEYLTLIGHVCKRTGRAARKKWHQPRQVPECFSFRLKFFLWKDYKWDEEDDSEIAKFILSKAKRLKKAAFFTSTTMDTNMRTATVEGLKSVVMASNSCELRINGEVYGEA